MFNEKAMCGIAGIYDRSAGAGALEASVRLMTSALTHRGPDDCGYHTAGAAALGHRRLSIIDLEGGRQPIYNEDGSISIVYNGEVYNFRALKTELEALGHRFRTRTDTETVLHAYEEWGEGCVKRLRGMFAFCIHDVKKDKLFLARDRLGIKPLFYSFHGGRLLFASEMKALLTDPETGRTIDKEALASYFIFSYIAAPLTIFSEIRKLRPGHIMTVHRGELRIERYWDLEFAPDHGKSEDRFIEEFMEILGEAVRMRLVSDVPVGVFLSGGIDSSTVVALMDGHKTRSFTIGFGGDTGGLEDEREYARLVARRYCTDHHEYEVQPRIEGIVDEIVTSFDEPFADDAAIPGYFVSETAVREVKVILSGLGGDEDFCGYERYLGFQIGRIYKRLPGILRRNFITRLIERLPDELGGSTRISHMKRFVRGASQDDHDRYLGFVTRLGEKYSKDFFNDGSGQWLQALQSASARFVDLFNSQDIEDPLNRVLYCDIKTYLPGDILACTDRMSMRHSLEVRVPFLDHKLVEYCATIPPGLKIRGLRKKYLLKKAVRPLLPEEVIRHKKQGFVGPMSRWLRTDLKETVKEKLSAASLEKHGLLNPATVGRIVDDHFSGRENNDSLIWSLLVFQRWFELYMDSTAGAAACWR